MKYYVFWLPVYFIAIFFVIAGNLPTSQCVKVLGRPKLDEASALPGPRVSSGPRVSPGAESLQNGDPERSEHDLPTTSEDDMFETARSSNNMRDSDQLTMNTDKESSEEEVLNNLIANVKQLVTDYIYVTTEKNQETWRHRKAGTREVYVRVSGSATIVRALQQEGRIKLKCKLSWGMHEKNAITLPFVAEGKESCMTLKFYVTNFNKIGLLRSLQSDSDRVTVTRTRAREAIVTKRKTTVIDLAIKIGTDYSLVLSIPEGDDHMSYTLFRPLQSLNTLLKHATSFGVWEKPWRSVLVTTTVSKGHVRIIEYSDENTDVLKKKYVTRRVPCFVCHERPDADALVESSVVLLDKNPVTLDWTPRSNILWWFSNIRRRVGFWRSGDDIVKEQLYKWLARCHASITLLENQRKYIDAVIQASRVEELTSSGFWVQGDSRFASLHMTLTAPALPVVNKDNLLESTSISSAVQFDVPLSFKTKRCHRNVHKSLLQRRYILPAHQKMQPVVFNRVFELKFCDPLRHKWFIVTAKNMIFEDGIPIPLQAYLRNRAILARDVNRYGRCN